MNRIPTEGLKQYLRANIIASGWSLNEQNPDRGIETTYHGARDTGTTVCLNEQNPDRGIETYPLQQRGTQCWRLNEQNPDRGIETTSPQLTPRQAAGLE